MSSDPFFASAPREPSLLKTELVTKYFDAWSKIMLNRNQANGIGFADLFSGAGQFQPQAGIGTDSTPMLIIKKVVSDDYLTRHVRLFFNDKNRHHIDLLRKRINSVEGVNRLKYQPIFVNADVGEDLYGSLSEFANIPTLYFVDPYGYKGVTSDLLAKTVSGYGSECILFFNFNRINSAISNPTVKHHMHGLFGQTAASALLSKLMRIDNSLERENLIVDSLADVLTQAGAKHQIRFRFEQIKSERTSHYIVFASKHFLGLKIMRDIMARASKGPDGVPVYEWKPQRSPQLSLDLGLNRAKIDDEIKELLIRNFSGRECTVGEIFVALSSGTTYTLPDFQRVIMSMEQAGSAVVDKPFSERPIVNGRTTLGEKRRVRILS